MSDKLVSNLESFASTVASDVKGINARLAKFNETHALISESETEPTGADKPLFWVVLGGVAVVQFGYTHSQCFHGLSLPLWLIHDYHHMEATV